MAINEVEFKQAMQLWASGITVITAQSAQYGLQGMTVTAFSSVSANPPLILCCLNGNADTLNSIDNTQSFAVNVLTDKQETTSNQFAGGCSHEERFANNAWHTGTIGLPLLTESLMSLECKLVEKVQAGSHWILIGEVQSSECRNGSPLLYYRSQYRELNH